MTAVDLDQRKLDYACRHYPYCTYQAGSIKQLDFDDNVFDFVISTEVFEHLPDPQRALRELHKVAKPLGYLIISVPFGPFSHCGAIWSGGNIGIAAVAPPVICTFGTSMNLASFYLNTFKS